MANCFYSDKLTLKASAVAASKRTMFDADNGEQEIDGYGVLNFKGEYRYSDNLSFTVGVDNLLDEAYAVSSTYKDLTFTSGGGEVVLLNESGRTLLMQLNYRFQGAFFCADLLNLLLLYLGVFINFSRSRNGNYRRGKRGSGRAAQREP